MTAQTRYKDPQYPRHYYQAHREELLVKQSAYARARLVGPDGDHVRALRANRVRRFRELRPEDTKRWHRSARKRLKLQMIAAYGGNCDCCGENRHEFLTLDHVNRDGNQHRATFGGRGIATSMQIWADLKRRGWPKDGFRVLCMNCNWATRYGTACPHTQFAPEQHAAFLSVI